MLHVISFITLNILYFHISTFRSMTVFCNSMILCFPVVLLRYFLNYFEITKIMYNKTNHDIEILPVVPILTSITFVFTLHMRCTSFVRSWIFNLFCFFLDHISIP
jgi:hypothetical protein